MTQKIAIYPGTFDPITFGHIDLIKRASRLFDHIVVGIAESSRKKTLFSLKERLNLAKQVALPLSNVTVIGFESLLIEFAKQQHSNTIIRGLRAVSDFEYELQLASLHHKLDPMIETIFLSPSAPYTYLSSSIVREIASFHGDVSHFVPKIVEDALEKKFKSFH